MSCDMGPREMSAEKGWQDMIILDQNGKPQQDTFNSCQTMTASCQPLPLNAISLLVYHQISGLGKRVFHCITIHVTVRCHMTSAC
jgi:hypothetical protein